MEKIRTVVVGFGNVGQFAVDAVLAAPDLELAGVVRRNPAEPQPACLQGIPIAASWQELGPVDAALLCAPTRAIPELAQSYLEQGIATVDSYDIHGELASLRTQLHSIAAANNTAAVISAGWDPGSDSVIRALLEIMAPQGITYTNFGPGMSMGHSTAVKGLPGVADALSLTIPLGTGLHRRMVYVELLPGADEEAVIHTIKTDPYFVNDETYVEVTAAVRSLLDMGHGVSMERRGVSGNTHNQRFLWNMQINNPALTAQIMAASVRAARRQQPGAYTMLEIPLIDFLPGDRDAIIHRLV